MFSRTVYAKRRRSAAIALAIVSLVVNAALPPEGLASSAPPRVSRTRLKPLAPAQSQDVAEVGPSSREEQETKPVPEVEIASAMRRAEAIRNGTLYRGTLESDASTPAVRFYMFEAAEGASAKVSFALDHPAEDFDTTVSIVDAAGVALPLLYTNKTPGFAPEEGQVFVVAIPENGTYFVRVTGSSSSQYKDAASYRLALRVAARMNYAISPLVVEGRPLLDELHKLQRRLEALDVEIEAFGRTAETNEKQARIAERMESIRAAIRGGEDSHKVRANSICSTGTLAVGDPTYNRVSTASTAGSCSTTTNTVNYDTFEFELTGCSTFPTSVTITLCNATCGTPDTSLDTFLAVYQASGGGAGAFNPASPCVNFVAQNADGTSVGCPNGSGGFVVLSGLVTNLNSGRFVVVVSSQFNTGPANAHPFGNYALNVSATSAGCNVSVPGACPTVNVTSSPSPPPSSVTVNTAYPSTTFSASGGTAPYTFSATGLPSGMSINPGSGVLSGTPTVPGLYHPVITATDSSANACAGSLSFDLTVTNVTLPCITDVIQTGGATFNGAMVNDTTSTGFGASCTPRAVNLLYKSYEFNLTGCSSATLTATLCGSGGCSPLTGSGALADSIVYVYRSGGSLTAGTGTSGAFNPASPCTNLVALNDQQGQTSSGGLGACGANGNLSGLTRTIGPGRFTIVVSGAFAANAGAFNLNVSVAGSGCSLALAGACTVTVTPSPNPVPTGAVNVPFTSTTFSGSGGTGPYTFSQSGTLPTGMTFNAMTATLSGTPTQQGLFPITINATDANNCIGSLAVNLVIQNVSPPCVTDVLTAGGPTFNGATVNDASSTGFGVTCSPRAVNLLYKAYEFNVSGCASATLTATLCGSGGCSPLTGSGALADSIVYVYRSGGSLTAGTGTSGAFNPASPCTNLVALNDQQGQTSSGGLGACGANGNLSGLTRTIGPGVFTIVVSGAFASNAGAFNLDVSLSGAGCSLCSVITGTVGGGGTICPGDSSTVSVSISGGVAPYTVTLNNGGGMQTSASPVNLMVSPASTTTYSVVSATDANGCPATVTGSATVTVQSLLINPTNQNFGAAGGSDSVNVTAPGSCGWMAASNDAWIMITSGPGGTGNGTVNYTVAANTGPSRMGTMTIAGHTFTVNQADGCTFSIMPTSMNFGAAGGSNSVAVTASDAGCMWTATSNDPWISVTSCHSKTRGVPVGCNFTGSGVVDYSVGANPSMSPRSGSITIAGHTFTVTQDGACAPPTPSTITGATSVVAGDGDLDGDSQPGYTYSVPSQSGATYTWSVSVGATIYAGQGTTSIQVVYDNSAGPFTVSVLISTGCGSDNPSLMTTKLHDGFFWQFVGMGTPAGWTEEVGTWQQSTGYENPAHAVSVPGGTLYESVSYGQVYGDFTYEAAVVASRDASTTGAAITLWFRGTPTPFLQSFQRWNRGFAFNIAMTGRYSIFRYSATGNTTLQSWTTPVGPTIYTDGMTPNVLKVVASGGTLQFYVNGTLVKTLTGQVLFPTGKVGVALVRTAGAPGDTLKVTYAKAAPSGFPLPKRAVEISDDLSLEQSEANDEANRLAPVADPLFDRGRRERP